MTATVVNLNRVRKARARLAGTAAAAANRARFGRTPAEREADGADAGRRAALLDRARLDD